MAEKPVVASVLPFQTSSAFVPKIMAQFEPMLSEAALAVLLQWPASAAPLNTGSNCGLFH
jgi:hypothetical protein